MTDAVLSLSFRSGEARITLFAAQKNAATYDFYVRLISYYGHISDGSYT